MTARPGRTEKLDLRLSPQAKRTITAAARAANRSVSEFVLDSALARAEETLVDRRVITLSGEAWDAFVAELDAPPRNLPGLARLMRRKAPWDREA